MSITSWRGYRKGQLVPAQPKDSGEVQSDQQAICRAVQAEIRKLLLGIIQEEVAAAHKAL